MPSRRSRPLRRVFGVLAGLVATADLVVATAVEGNRFGVPVVAASTQGPMLVYGVFLICLALWAIATSFAGRMAKATRQASPDAAPPAPVPVVPSEDGSAERAVVHQLRRHGWYVADDVELAGVDVDHVAIGPAGVIAIQVMWTNRPDGRGKPSARARIAARQLRGLLATKELNLEVVPAVLAFGPGLTEEPGGVKVVDSVAILFGDQHLSWIAELSRRELLAPATVDAVRAVVADLREGLVADVPVLVG